MAQQRCAHRASSTASLHCTPRSVVSPVARRVLVAQGFDLDVVRSGGKLIQGTNQPPRAVRRSRPVVCSDSSRATVRRTSLRVATCRTVSQHQLRAPPTMKWCSGVAELQIECQNLSKSDTRILCSLPPAPPTQAHTHRLLTARPDQLRFARSLCMHACATRTSARTYGAAT